MHQTDEDPEETEEAMLRKLLIVLGVGSMALITASGRLRQEDQIIYS